MKHIIPTMTLLCICLLAVLPAGAAPGLSLDSVTIPNGGNGTLNLSMSDGTESYGGVNAKLRLPDGITVTGVTRGDLLTADFSSDWKVSSDGQYLSLIAYSRTATFTGSGVMVSLALQAGAAAPAGTVSVSFAGGTQFINDSHALSNASGDVSVLPDVTNGMVTIQAAQIVDTDKDGLPDDWELQIVNADPNDAIQTIEDVTPGGDFDNDGLINLQEYTTGTNPVIPSTDTDQDGMPDDWELQIINDDPNDAIQTIADVLPSGDFDKDGLINLQEYMDGTSPIPVIPVTDNDQDGLPDDWELQIVNADPNDAIQTIDDVLPDDDYDNDGQTNLQEYTDGTNPVIPSTDIDQDGMPDDWELQIINDDPNDAIQTIDDVLPNDDYDNDGQTNLQEYTDGTNPVPEIQVEDADQDGLPDSWELQIINDNPDDAFITIADVLPAGDYDNDGLINLQEYIDGTSPVTPFSDTDRDGLPDDWELQIINDDPNDAIQTIDDVLPTGDYDNDGLINLQEYMAGTSPVGLGSPVAGDLNGDTKITLADTILGLQALSGIQTSNINMLAEVNSDNKIGLEEVIYTLRKISGL